MLKYLIWAGAFVFALTAMLPLPTFASGCGAPARAIMLAAYVANQHETQSIEVNAALSSWWQGAEQQAKWVAATPIADLAPAAREAFYQQVEANTAERMQRAATLVALFKREGATTSATTFQHYINTQKTCASADARKANLLVLANTGELPQASYPLQQQNLQALTGACADVLWANGVPPELGTPAFWQACAQVALDAASRSNFHHFDWHHKVAEPLCALNTPVPDLRKQLASLTP